jgi:hypothetical protein
MFRSMFGALACCVASSPRMLFLLHVVTEQCVLVANVEIAMSVHRMCPRWPAGAVALLEATSLDVFFLVWLDEEHGAFFGAVSFEQGLRGAARPGL